MILDHVSKIYGKGKKEIRAVDGVSLSILQGKSTGLVGESGSGKSTIAKLIMGLEKETDGRIYHQETNEAISFKPGDIQMIFQDPQSSLNPRMRVREIIMEPLFALPSQERMAKGTEEKLMKLVQAVGLQPEQLNRYPHAFSGGQRQRIAIARSLITEPSMLILDEPTSALDVSVQAQVLNLLKSLKKERGLTYFFISHNMSVIRYMCDTIAVMYKGKIVEQGTREEIFENPTHPYTKQLFSALPSVAQLIK